MLKNKQSFSSKLESVPKYFQQAPKTGYFLVKKITIMKIQQNEDEIRRLLSEKSWKNEPNSQPS